MLRLRVFTLPGSAPRTEASPSALELSALGDFEPGNESAEVLPTDRAGATLRFPAETQAVEARVSAQGLLGYGERRGDAGVDVLLWSERDSVVLSSGAYPGRGGGQALGYSERVGALLVAGGNNPLDTESLVGTLRFDAGTGRIEQSGVASGGLAHPRAFATVTAFGDGFLVAGGQQPVEGVPEAELELHGTAELVGPEGGPIQLQNTRTHHAALSLADGRTLLIGGRTKVGSVSIAQYQLELVDPATRRSFVGDAIAPRIDPTALRLTDGRAFVGGGVRLDGSLTAPVGEWLDENGRRDPTTLSAEVPPRFDRAFIAAAGGGLLAVGGCEDRPPASEEDAAACGVCRSGCPPLDGYDAWWIDADGAAQPVSLRGVAAPQPRLLPGSDGSPWLVAADETNPDVPRLFRFNPWASRFERSAVPESRLPRPGLPAFALGPDTFAWVDEGPRGAELVGLRLGVRSRFARDVALVLASEPLDPLWPVHLVPTRAPGEGTRYDGALSLAEPTVAILVADTDYADVTIRLRVSSAALPRVLLGESELGGEACPWPDGDERGAEAEQPTVVRRGTLAELRFHGGRTTACSVASGRLPVGLVAGPRPAVVRELQLTRDGARR